MALWFRYNVTLSISSHLSSRFYLTNRVISFLWSCNCCLRLAISFLSNSCDLSLSFGFSQVHLSVLCLLNFTDCWMGSEISRLAKRIYSRLWGPSYGACMDWCILHTRKRCSKRDSEATFQSKSMVCWCVFKLDSNQGESYKTNSSMSEHCVGVCLKQG